MLPIPANECPICAHHRTVRDCWDCPIDSPVHTNILPSCARRRQQRTVPCALYLVVRGLTDLTEHNSTFDRRDQTPVRSVPSRPLDRTAHQGQAVDIALDSFILSTPRLTARKSHPHPGLSRKLSTATSQGTVCRRQTHTHRGDLERERERGMFLVFGLCVLSVCPSVVGYSGGVTIASAPVSLLVILYSRALLCARQHSIANPHSYLSCCLASSPSLSSCPPIASPALSRNHQGSSSLLCVAVRTRRQQHPRSRERLLARDTRPTGDGFLAPPSPQAPVSKTPRLGSGPPAFG